MAVRNEGLWGPWLQKIPLLSAQGDLGMMSAVLVIILTRVPTKQKQNDTLWYTVRPCGILLGLGVLSQDEKVWGG